MKGAWESLLTTDAHHVPIDILNAGKLCFDAIYSTNFRIEMYP